MHQFFYRIDGLSLAAGNKSAGFSVEVRVKTLLELSKTPMDPKIHESLMEQMRERILNAGVLPKRIVQHCGFALRKGSCVPLMFTTHPAFGSSLCGDPNFLEALSDIDDKEFSDVLAVYDDLDDTSISYTPHNVDSPGHALALLIMFETWAEWAYLQLAHTMQESK